MLRGPHLCADLHGELPLTHLRIVAFAIAAGLVIAAWGVTCGAWHFSRIAEGFTPPEPRALEALTVIAVGTGNAYENPARRGPCTAVGLGSEIALVDAGRSVAEGLRIAGIPARQPALVLLTNLLPENTTGLDDLWIAAWLDGRSAPLRIAGPRGTAQLVAHLTAAHAESASAQAAALGLPAPAPPNVEEIAGGATLSLGALAISSGELPGGPVPALAYRFEARSRSAVIAGTGWAPDALAEFARGAKLLLHEASFSLTPDQVPNLELPPETAERLLREARLHTAVDAVGDLARRAGVETLGLVRLRPPPAFRTQLRNLVDDSFSGSIWIPEDGDELTP
jgi:ribonuclease BN (tRNA processing enzyme)